MKFAIDAHPFIWGIKKKATEGQTDNIRKAEEFFKWADANKHIIMIPTVVLAEILVGETDENRDRYLKIINKNFVIAPFDARVANVYSKILTTKKDQILKNNNIVGITKQQMKIDHIIIATAKANGVEALITQDKGLIKFSDGIINTENLKENYITSCNQLSLIPNLDYAS